MTTLHSSCAVPRNWCVYNSMHNITGYWPVLHLLSFANADSKICFCCCYCAEHTRCRVINGQWEKWHVNKWKLLGLTRASFVAISKKLLEEIFCQPVFLLPSSSCCVRGFSFVARKTRIVTVPNERKCQKNRKQTNKNSEKFFYSLRLLVIQLA